MSAVQMSAVAGSIHRDEVTLHTRCSCCGTEYHFTVSYADFRDWLFHGKLLQEAMPYLSADERELLISSTCGWCFDNLFGEG